MISNQTVLIRLMQTVTLDDMGTEEALSLCSACIEEITANLKDSLEQNNPRLIQPMAALAFYRIALRQSVNAETLTSFKAGDVTVTRTPCATLEIASKARDEAFAAVADLLIDRQFIFQQVDI